MEKKFSFKRVNLWSYKEIGQKELFTVEEFQFSTVQDFRVHAIIEQKKKKKKKELVTMRTVSCCMSMQPNRFSH